MPIKQQPPTGPFRAHHPRLMSISCLKLNPIARIQVQLLVQSNLLPWESQRVNFIIEATNRYAAFRRVQPRDHNL